MKENFKQTKSFTVSHW